MWQSYLAISIASSLMISANVRAKFVPSKDYVHPVGAIEVRETKGTNKTAFRWTAIYRFSPQNPKIQAKLKAIGGSSNHFGLSDAALRVYADRVRSTGTKIETSIGSTFTYFVRDRTGQILEVLVRNESDPKVAEFGVIIAIPGG